MSEESGFNLLIKNQSNKDRIIRVIVAVALIVIYFIVDSSMNSSIATIGLVIAGALLFNGISGNCYVYRVLGLNTCPLPEPDN